jgi:hypothetical protein
MIYGVTGPAVLLEDTWRWHVRAVVKRNVLRSKKNKLVSGVAYGVDTEAIIAVWGLIPFENLILTVPGTCRHNYALVDKAENSGAIIIRVPNRHTVGETYLARDDETVRQLGQHGKLLAFPRTPDPILRSGTWATIRRASKAGNTIRYYPFSAVRV